MGFEYGQIFISSLMQATEVLSKLYAAHQGDQKYAGVDIEAGVPAVCNAVSNKILDLYLTKHWALKFATTAACTVLRVDQVCTPHYRISSKYDLFYSSSDYHGKGCRGS